jgi:hypothetical protein
VMAAGVFGIQGGFRVGASAEHQCLHGCEFTVPRSQGREGVGGLGLGLRLRKFGLWIGPLRPAPAHPVFPLRGGLCSASAQGLGIADWGRAGGGELVLPQRRRGRGGMAAPERGPTGVEVWFDRCTKGDCSFAFTFTKPRRVG